MQLLATLFFGLMLGLLAGGGAGLYWLGRRLRASRSLEGGDPRRLAVPIQVRRDDAWFRGDDLLRHPRRLAALEARLKEQHAAATSQADRLAERAEELGQRPAREELARRYEEDERLLRRRAERMGRVLGMVWKARALLGLRAHVAITARRRPVLRDLPEAEVPVGELAQAARRYDLAADAVRAFVVELDSRANDLDEVVPLPAEEAVVTDTTRMAVEGERNHALQTYAELRGRMEELADTLAYLGERCRTRALVEGGPAAELDEPGADGAGLIEELNRALGELSQMAEAGDKKLADAAMDKLAEEISLLEKAGIDAQAETDAVLEVQRLLETWGRS